MTAEAHLDRMEAEEAEFVRRHRESVEEEMQRQRESRGIAIEHERAYEDLP